MDMGALFKEGIAGIPGALLDILAANPKLIVILVLMVLIAITAQFRKNKIMIGICLALCILLVIIGLSSFM